MSEPIHKGTTKINAYIIAYAEDVEDIIALAVSKNTGELFVCTQIITATQNWWEVTPFQPHQYEWGSWKTGRK